MYANAIQAMDAVRSAIQAANMPSSEELDRQISESLSLVSAAMGASRACLCFVGVDQNSDVIERFFTGGDPAVLPVGPALLGIPLQQIPELAAVLDSDVGCVVIETQTASDAFSRIFDGLKFDWIASNALRDGDTVISLLFLVGRGEAPDPADVPCLALSAISEAMRPVIRASSLPPAASEAIRTQALTVAESLGLGLVVLDSEHRIRYANHLAEAMLGATTSELQGEALMAEHWDLRSLDGTTVTSALLAEALGSPTTWDNPIDLQLRNRAGRTVPFRVAAGPLVRWNQASGDRRPVMLMELTGTQGPVRAAEAADSQAEFVGLLANLRTALDDLEVLRGTHLLSRSFPPAFDALTVRETEILNYLLEGVRVSTIAQCLYLSQHTVRNHLRAIFKKVGVTSQAELIRLARDLG